MNTSDRALTESEINEIKSNMAFMQADSAKQCIATMQKEIEWLSALLPIVSNTQSIPDELIIPMHNIISVVPEEQYRFLFDLKKMFGLLPEHVREQPKVKYVINRLEMMDESDLNTKASQPTDLSQYWAAYRQAVYMYGVEERSRARGHQVMLRKKMHRIVNTTIAKRKQGIKTAELIIGGKASLV